MPLQLESNQKSCDYCIMEPSYETAIGLFASIDDTL